jgi:[CysO sulfur-carrier protein]-S-L-cysteine hydrolase
MKIARDLLDEVTAHALEDPKNEVCGVVAVEEDGSGSGVGQTQTIQMPQTTRALAAHRAINVHASPLKFEIDPAELLELYNSIEAAGLTLGAIYHSHVRSAPYPSQTDIGFAANWPGVEWIIVGLKDGEAPEVRSYLIENGRVREVALQVQ